MGGFSNGGTVRTKTDELTDGDVTVERTVEHVERGVVVTLTAESVAPERVEFALVEAFPPSLPVSDAGFLPGTEPAGGYVDADGARVEDAVDPDGELTVVYALQFFEPAPGADLGDPELVVGGARTVAGETSSVRARGGATTASTGPSDADEGWFSVAETPDQFGSGDRRRAATDGSGTDVAATDGPAARSPDDGDGDASTTDHADAVETAERVDEAVETAERVRGSAAGSGASMDERTAPAAADGSTGAAKSGGVVAALVTELREGAVSDRERAALRRELGVGHASPEDVRIERLESRMSEFAAYADALGDVIDEYGTADAFVGRFEDRIDGLGTDVEAVESELSATRETLDGVEDRLEALAEEFEALEERTGDIEVLREGLADVESSVERLREEVDARHGRNAEAVDRLEARVDAVESLREELASVFDEVDGSD